jgi:hypothetical protein
MFGIFVIILDALFKPLNLFYPGILSNLDKIVGLKFSSALVKLFVGPRDSSQELVQVYSIFFFTVYN